LVSVAWLLGFYVLAAGIVAAVVIGNVVFIATTQRAIGAILVPSVAVVIAIVKGTLFVERRTGADSVNGFEVDERTQPELTGMVRSVATEMGTQPPARIFLVPDVNAYVLQSGSFLGIVPGERIMALGLGIVNSLTVDQLRAVVAHELGHYAGGDTRLGPLSYRAGATIYRTVEHLGPQSMIGKVFQAYGRRYLMLSLRVRRRQELSADAAAVRLAGRENHVAALRRVAAAAPAWSCSCSGMSCPSGSGAGSRRTCSTATGRCWPTPAARRSWPAWTPRSTRSKPTRSTPTRRWSSG
jgi:Zn-dependent protease with chaperone function